MKLSLIVPTYNSEKYLKKLLDSILPVPWYEIIFVDDGSTDMSIQILQKFCDIKESAYIISGKHRGVSYSRNIGLKRATGDYIMFMDSDDLLISEPLINFMKKNNQSFDMVLFTSTANQKYIYQNLKISTRKSLIANILRLPSNIQDNNFLFDSGPCSRIYKRKLIMDNKLLFDENIKFGEDLIFNIEVLNKSGFLAVVPQGIYLYRYNFESVSRGLKYDQISNSKFFFERLSNLVDQTMLAERRALSFIRNMKKAILFNQPQDILIKIVDFYTNDNMCINGFSLIQRVLFYLSINKVFWLISFLIVIKDHISVKEKLGEFTKI